MTLVRESAALLLAAIVLGGCAGGADPPGAPGWQEPGRYTYVLNAACGERLLIGTFRVSVVDATVVKVDALDEPAQRVLEIEEPSDPVPTIGQLLKRAEDARAQGAHRADVTYDETDGHPTRVDIDYEKDAIDDEECYRITGYTIGA